jgi:hypothetical protein
VLKFTGLILVLGQNLVLVSHPVNGSSKFGIVLTEHLKSPDIVRVLDAEEFESPSPPCDVDLKFKNCQ